MIIKVANPIYDSVFKYLMEDERIAKTVLSALLKKQVVSVKIRRNEYSNGTRNSLSMFRIDFGAQIRQADGSLRLILIELQKTWLETETLRFRQYLGAQYANPENMVNEEMRPPYGLPMVAVYILGHRVGNIDEPVLYVDHKTYDYDGNEVTKGLPDPFVDSLVHRSIIVQIPLLHGQINNRLDKVLSVFDQKKQEKGNQHVMELNEDLYTGDSDMEYILRRLLMASSDAKLRQDMNVEDEYFKAIEDRDTAIMSRDKMIKEQDGKIKEQDGKIKEQDGKIKEQDGKIKEQKAELTQKDAQLSQKAAELTQKDAQLSQKDAQLSQKDAQLLKLMQKLKEQGLSNEDIEQLIK